MANIDEFLSGPFIFFDTVDYPLLRNFKKHRKIRDALLLLSIPCMAMWFLTGFDSGCGQIDWVAKKWFEAFISGKPFTWTDAVYHWNWAYGKFMHWSAFVIYGWMYYLVSTSLETNLDLKNSQNSVYTFTSVFLNVAAFETFWMCSFAYFQDQWWNVTFQWPQMRILLQNSIFLGVVGLLGLTVFWLYSHDEEENRIYKFKPNMRFLLVTLITIGSVVFWINYPWHVEKITVPVVGYGLWTNSNKFPQTLYTIDEDITDKMSMGTQYFVENNTIHAVNTLVKTLFALTGWYYMDRWKKV